MAFGAVALVVPVVGLTGAVVVVVPIVATEYRRGSRVPV